MDFTTDDWVFALDGTPPKEDIEPAMQVPYLADPEAWEQYSDPVVYEIDVLMRKWIAKASEDNEWKRSYRKRRYKLSMIYEQLYGRPYDQKRDAKMLHRLTKVVAYYSTRIQNSGSINGKTTSKKIYTIGPGRLKKPPYSLKLRLEWLNEQGIMPDKYNMKLPKDDLKAGHARNPKTDANMERRREDGRRRYRERYGNNKHS